MGNWQLEVARMMLYISFPIGIFYYFNHGKNVEDWLLEQRKKYYSESEKQHEQFLLYVDNFNKNKQAEQLKNIET